MAAAHGAKALHTLSSRAVVSVHGSDAEAFLQGLTTNDVPNLPDGTCMYTGFLNHSGRLLVRSPLSPPHAPVARAWRWQLRGENASALPQYDAFLHKRGANDLLADVDASALSPFLKHLKKFKLRSNVTVSDASSDSCVAWDPSSLDTSLPPDPRLSHLGCRGILSSDAASRFVNDGDGSSSHRHLRFSLGVGEGTEMDGEIPLECNFDGLSGVSFTKGCYLGQELIARTHFRGSVRKRLVPIQAESSLSHSVEKGTSIGRSSGKGRSPGRVLTLDSSGHGLALLRLASLHEEGLCVGTANGTRVGISALQPSWWPPAFTATGNEQHEESSASG